jgi:hypothetical protein
MTASSTASQEALYREKCVAAVSEVVSEPVINAALFSRRGLYTKKLLGRFGLIPYLLGAVHAKAQASGLPERFMLAITPTHVRAFKYKAHGRMRDRYEVGEQVAVWDRSTIKVTWQRGGPYETDVTIEAPEEAERVLCRCGRGASTETFLQLMSEPLATG